MLTPEDHREIEERAMSLVGSGHTVSHYESAIITRDGRRRLFSWNNTVLRDLNGNPTGVASIGEDITDRRDAERELERLAYHDPLTGLPNRILFQEHLDLALARARRSGDGVAVLYVDLDDFKLVNDSFGHGAGDQLLCEVSRGCRGATRASDVVARQGGDEFLILIADLDVGDDQGNVDIEDVARRVADQVRTALQTPMVLADTEIYTSASLGISLFPVDAADAESLLKHADIAMYKAKDGGRDRLPAVRRRRERSAGAALDGGPAAAGGGARGADPALPAAGRPGVGRARSGPRRCCAGMTAGAVWSSQTRSSRWPSAPA